MKYVIYCRKSSESEDRQIRSLSAQETEMLEIAERDELQVIKIFRESMSAKDTGRPIFNEMIKMIRAGKADGILCWKLDRLARNMVDGGQIMDLLQKSVIKEIRTHESTHLSSETTLMLAFNFADANQFIRTLSANVKRGNRDKMRRGEWPNHAPFGYKNERVNKLVEPNLKVAPVIPRIFELYSTGNYTMKEVMNVIYQEGFRTASGKKITKSTVDKVLKNPFYFGRMCREEECFDGKHQPLISKELFDLVQEVLAENMHPRKKHLFFPFRGLLSCEYCRCAYTASLKKGHKYLYCTNGKGICEAHKKYLRSEKVAELITDTLSPLSFDEELIEIMHDASREKYLSGSKYHEEVKNRIEQQLEGLEEEELAAFDAYSKKLLRVELYERKVDEIETKRKALKKSLKILPQKDVLATLEPIKSFFLKANRAKKQFLEIEERDQHIMASEILWNLSIEDGKVAQAKYKGAYEILASTPKNADLKTLLAG